MKKNEPDAHAIGLVLVLGKRGDKTGELHFVFDSEFLHRTGSMILHRAVRNTFKNDLRRS
jgi:hypothetical protein